MTVLPALMSFTTRPSPSPASRKRCAIITGAQSCLTRTAVPALTLFKGQNAGFSDEAPIETLAPELRCPKLISTSVGCGERATYGHWFAADFGCGRYGGRMSLHQFRTQAGFLIELSHFVLEDESNEEPAQENGPDGHGHGPGGSKAVACHGRKCDGERRDGYC